MRFKFGLPRSPITLPNIESAHGLELQIVRAAYEDILSGLKDLRWFNRVNNTAIERIFAKIGNYKYEKSTFNLCHSPWAAAQQSIDESWAEAFGRVNRLRARVRNAPTTHPT